MRISTDDYLMGRETIYPDELTPEVARNATRTVSAVNALLDELEADLVDLEIHPVNRTVISSGWRPPQINRQVNGAAVRSKHMTGEACDIYDPDGTIDDWCMENQDTLERLGLYLEHPSATKGWAHVQVVPPKSGKRVFYP